MQLIIPAFNEERRLPGDTARAARLRARCPRGARPGRGHRRRQREHRRDRRGGASASTRRHMPVRVVHCAEARQGCRGPRRRSPRPTPTSSAFMDADGATELAALAAGVSDSSRPAPTSPSASRALPDSVTCERHSRVRAAGRRRLPTPDPRGRARTWSTPSAASRCSAATWPASRVRRARAAAGFSFDVEVLARCQRRGRRGRGVPGHVGRRAGLDLRPGPPRRRPASCELARHRLAHAPSAGRSRGPVAVGSSPCRSTGSPWLTCCPSCHWRRRADDAPRTAGRRRQLARPLALAGRWCRALCVGVRAGPGGGRGARRLRHGARPGPVGARAASTGSGWSDAADSSPSTPGCCGGCCCAVDVSTRCSTPTAASRCSLRWCSRDVVRRSSCWSTTSTSISSGPTSRRRSPCWAGSSRAG